MNTNAVDKNIEIGKVTARLQCRICKTSAGMTGGDKTVFFDFEPNAEIIRIPKSVIENFNKFSHTSGSIKCARGTETKGLEVRFFALDIPGVSDDIIRLSVNGLVFTKIREGRFKCVFDHPQDINFFIA